jgi:transposase InsO family protein
MLALRRRRPRWGARKLRWELQQLFPRRRVPSVRTLHRWLCVAGLTRRNKRRSRAGPLLSAVRPQHPRSPNDVWTVDFKGRDRTGDGTRIEPLTVRDLATRYGLAIVQLPGTDEANVRRAFVRIFRRFGMPRAIQVDNGPPFGGAGALGLTRLSVWWVRLGIRVQFGRPRCPQDNAAHEQWHSVISAETFQPTSLNARAQQRRFARALHDYNHCRPHEALGMRVPARLYRKSPRPYPPHLPVSRYPTSWSTLHVPADGRVFFASRQRMIGRAFAGQHIALRPAGAKRWRVYLDRHLIGELVATDRAGMRPAKRERYHNGSPQPD